ncbi:MAG TPA: GTPase HflX [Flavobacteriia bacterium]|nr:GTPase HflX [Flavobacteriia bacterium]
MIEKTVDKYEKIILIGIINQSQSEEKVKEYLKELAFLSETAGGKVAKTFVQKLDKPNPKTFLGSGKLDEIKQYIDENEVDSVIFDDELSPAQQKNLEKILQVKIIDRTRLILDIFAQRAQTSYARTQVELAQYQYLLPRLTGMWTHLERQRGGIGMRGPGETEIETDRRIIRDKIALLKKKLKAIDKQMATQRGNRGKMVRAALIGYTNVGKSTLMNVLSKSDVFAENKLFATLDTTVRKIVVHNIPFLLTDTVGFIRKLPTQLIESFKSTLNEVTEADLLIHVVDLSHPNFEEHMQTVHQILNEIKAGNKPMVIVFNKTDLLPETEENKLENLKKTWLAKTEHPTVFISAVNKLNIDTLKDVLYNQVRKIHIKRFPYNDFLYPDLNLEN